MAENSGIEWTNHTFNPWRGCARLSEGCRFCYAETLSKRNPGTLGIWGAHGTRVVAAESYWRQPLKWDREAAATGERRRVFCASMADVFEDWQGRLTYPRQKDEDGEWIYPQVWYGPKKVEGSIRDEILSAGQMLVGCGYGKRYRHATLDDVRRRLFALIDATPHLDWILLTKRPENILRLGCGPGEHDFWEDRPNVWLGTSVENQAAADERIPHLLRVPAAVRFLSVEPLLGPVSLWLPCEHHGPVTDGPPEDCGACDGFGRSPLSEGGSGIDWVIVGGESGPNARPMHPDWARAIRDQCQAAGVAFFFKQWGEYLPTFPYERVGMEYTMGRVGKKAAGRLLDGREWSEFPSPEHQGA